MINRINSNSNYLLGTNIKNKTVEINEDFEIMIGKENSKNKILIENQSMNSVNSEAVFRKYGLTSQYSIGENLHLYDVSNFADEFDFELENNQILSFVNEAGSQQFRCRFNYPRGGRVINVNIHLPNYSSDIPMDEKTFEDNIIKGFKAICKTLSTKNQLGDKQLDSYGISVAYDESTKSLDTAGLEKSLLNNINRRTMHISSEGYNGDMNLMVNKLQLMKSVRSLEEFLDEIFKQKWK